jgi:hypothetical protein
MERFACRWCNATATIKNEPARPVSRALCIGCEMDERLPDLPDIMAAGLGLSDALAWWSAMMNTPGRPCSEWWAELREERVRSRPWSDPPFSPSVQ